MAAYIPTTPWGVNALGLSARHLLRAAGPGRILTTSEVLALVADAPPVALAPGINRDRLDTTSPHATERHARVLRQHDAGSRPRASKGFVTGFGQRRHGRFSRSVLPISVRVRS